MRSVSSIGVHGRQTSAAHPNFSMVAVVESKMEDFIATKVMQFQFLKRCEGI